MFMEIRINKDLKRTLYRENWNLNFNLQIRSFYMNFSRFICYFVVEQCIPFIYFYHTEVLPSALPLISDANISRFHSDTLPWLLHFTSPPGWHKITNTKSMGLVPTAIYVIKILIANKYF